MAKLLLLAAVLGACGSSDPGGSSYKVTWTVDDSTVAAGTATCDSYLIDAVVFTASDTTSGDTHTVSHACADGAAELDGVPVGTYDVKLEAMGTAGDLAGRAEIASTITDDGMVIDLPPVAIEVAAPIMYVRTTWQVMNNGSPSTCTGAGATGVSVSLTPDGGTTVTDIWDCDEPNAKTMLAYGPFDHAASLLGQGDVIIDATVRQSLAGGRGTITVPVTLGQ